MTRVLVVGDLVVDVRVAPTREPVAGEEVEGRITTGGGGSAANQAAWLVRLGAEVVFVGRVGDDDAGARLVDELVAAGVEAVVARDPEHPTGMVAALLSPAASGASSPPEAPMPISGSATSRTPAGRASPRSP